MINLIVIAGDQTDDLSEHLQSNSAFKVVFHANSLLGAKDEIQNSIIKADKLLYVYHKNQMNIRNDMAFLRELFLSDSFFEVKEVLFIQKEDVDSEQAEKYFINIMQDVSNARKGSKKYNNEIEYYYKTVKNLLTFQSINEILLGVSQSAVVKNTISKFYRYEKGNSAKEVYVADKKQGAYVEPFNFDSLINHDRERQNMNTIQGVSIPTKSNDSWHQFEKMQLGDIDITDTQIYKNITVISGNAKTGKTTLACFLAASLENDGRKSLVLDFTANQDCDALITELCKKMKKRTVKDLLLSNASFEETIEFVNFDSNELYDLRMDVFILLLQKQLNSYEHVLIVAETKDLDEILYSAHESLNKILFCLTPLEKDVLTCKEQLMLMAADAELLVVLSDRIALNQYTKFLAPEKVKELLGGIKIVKSLKLEDVTQAKGLHTAILGGVN